MRYLSAGFPEPCPGRLGSGVASRTPSRPNPGAAPERTGQQWALAILLDLTRYPCGPGLLCPLLPLPLLPLLLPSAAVITSPPRLQSPRREGSREPPLPPGLRGRLRPCLARWPGSS